MLVGGAVRRLLRWVVAVCVVEVSCRLYETYWLGPLLLLGSDAWSLPGGAWAWVLVHGVVAQWFAWWGAPFRILSGEWSRSKGHRLVVGGLLFVLLGQVFVAAMWLRAHIALWLRLDRTIWWHNIVAAAMTWLSIAWPLGLLRQWGRRCLGVSIPCTATCPSQQRSRG